MNIIYRFKDSQHIFNVVTEAKRLCKDKGVKIKDLGDIRLTQMDWGLSMALFDKNGKLITNCAC